MRPLAGDADEGIAAQELPSLGRNSMARLGAIVGRLTLGIGSAVVTARVLGPAEKGALSTLLFLTTLLTYAGALGLGEAGTVLAGNRQVSRERAIAASTPAAIVASFLGIGVLGVASGLADWRAITGAVALSALVLPISVIGHLFGAFVNSLEQLTFTAAIMVASSAVGLVATVLFVAVLDLGVVGGVGGAAVGSGLMALAYAWRLLRAGLLRRPTFDGAYLRQALPFGGTFESGHLLAAVAERADLLIVYALIDEESAGIYAIALTIGRLSVYVPNAIAGAAFPRLAKLHADDARLLIPRAARLSLVTATATAIALSITMPLGIPFAFGDAFSAAITPAIVVAIAGIGYGTQLALATAAASRGHSAIYFASFAASVISMIVLDLLLVTRWGLTGAAVASCASAVIGALVVIVGLRRVGLMDLHEIVPGRHDISELVSLARRMIGRGANAVDAQA